MKRKSRFKHSARTWLFAASVLSLPIARSAATGQQPAMEGASLRVRIREQETTSVVPAEVSVKDGKGEHVTRSDSSGVARLEGLVKGSVETVAISTRGKNPSRAKMTDCVMRTVVDGIVMPAMTNIDNIYPREVYGVEVFYGAARLPPSLGGLRTDNWCGVIAIWTR